MSADLSFHSVFKTAALWLFWAPVFWAAGSICLRSWSFKDVPMRGIFILGLGMGLSAYFCVFAGYLHVLNPVFLSGVGGGVLLLGRKHLKAFSEWLKQTWRFLFVPSKDPVLTFLQTALAGTFLLLLAVCFFPETANDALAHHLNLAKRYAVLGRIAPLHFDIKSYQSLLFNGLYTLSLLYGSGAWARTLHAATGFLTVLFLTVWIERGTGRRRLAFFLGLMLWLTPALINEAATAYVDLGAVFFVLLSFCLLSGACPGRGGRPDFFLGGVFLGLGAATKLSVMLAVAGIGAVEVFRLFETGDKKKKVARLLQLAAGFCLASGFFFARNFILTGDPLFPMFSRLPLANFKEVLHALGIAKTLPNLLLLPFYLTFRPADFDYHFWIGPFYLCALPLVLWAVRADRGARQGALFFLVYGLGWFWMGQDVRYLLPALPVFLWTAASGFDLAARPGHAVAKKIAGFSGIVFVLFLSALMLYHFRWQMTALKKGWKGDEYLTQMERSFPAADWINRHLAPGAKILVLSEVRLFYFDPEVVRASAVQQIDGLQADDADEKWQAFIKKEGITHILDSRLRQGQSHEHELPAHLMTALSGQGRAAWNRRLERPDFAVKIFETDSQNVKEDRYHYTLYVLQKA